MTPREALDQAAVIVEKDAAAAEAILATLTDLGAEAPPPPPGLDVLGTARFHEVLGGWALQRGKAALAVSSFRLMIALEREGGESEAGLAESMAKLGRALAAAGELDEATESLGAALAEARRLGGDEAVASIQLDTFNVMLEAGRFIPAADALIEANAWAEANAPEMDTSPMILQVVAKALEQLAQVNKLRVTLEQARQAGIADSPELADAQELYEQLGDPRPKMGELLAAAERAAARVCAKAPPAEHADALIALSDMFATAERSSEAADRLRAALACLPEPEPWVRLAQTYRLGVHLFNADRNAEALAVAEEALAMSGRTASTVVVTRIWTLLGRALAVAGDHAHAVEALLEARAYTELLPEDAERNEAMAKLEDTLAESLDAVGRADEAGAARARGQALRPG